MDAKSLRNSGFRRGAVGRHALCDLRQSMSQAKLQREDVRAFYGFSSVGETNEVSEAASVQTSSPLPPIASATFRTELPPGLDLPPTLGTRGIY